MSTPPALVADRYRLVRLLGAGGMGVVWEAWDERLHRTVALKMLRTQPEFTDAERQLATDRAMREARITAGLHHPHAVTVFDVVEHDGQPCIVMQLIESTPLSALLSEHGRFSPADTARIGAQVASALAAAHRLKIVHRDVKPGNILIDADGSAMISDFGISHALGDTTITATGLIHGTPAYLAPEAAQGLPMSFASDVFSLGSTLYAMMEGRPPFGSEPNAIALLHKVARGGYPPPEHSGPLAPLLNQMLATQPKRRPTMAAVVEALDGFRQGRLDVPAAHVAAAALLPDAAAAAPAEEATTERIEDAAAPAAGIADAAVTTERIEDAPAPTARIEDAAVTTERIEDAPAPTARVDHPARQATPTEETERLDGPQAPLGGSGVASAGTAAADAPEAVPARRTSLRRGALVAGILILLVALAIGAWGLLDLLRPAATPDAQPTSSPTTASSAPAESPSPDQPAPSATAPATQEPTETAPAPAPQTPEERVVDAISGYYALMPGQRDSAWPLMTADYQENHAGGRDGYEAFWSAISAVEVTDISASGPDSGQATLTYHFTDGRVVQEVTAYRFVDEGGVLKVAETDVLSSTEL